YINWQAFARSGHYTMKLYREEVSPRVDLLLDRSPSMFFDPAKCLRVWELFFFAYESALQAGASVRMYSVNDDELRELPREKIESLTVDIADSGSSEGVPFSSIPWRPGALRIVISDLLFPPRDTAPLAPLAHGNGRGILFVPHARSESDPDWNGNLTLVDCESGARRRQFVSVELMDRYRRNYAR